MRETDRDLMRRRLFLKGGVSLGAVALFRYKFGEAKIRVRTSRVLLTHRVPRLLTSIRLIVSRERESIRRAPLERSLLLSEPVPFC